LSCAYKAEERTSLGNYLLKLRWPNANAAEKKEGEARAMSELTARMKRRIKRRLGEERPTVWIGKNGASEESLKEIEKQLEKKKMVKIKILKSALEGDEAKEIASRIAEQTEASLVEVRGHTFMLYKHRKK
jgi:putative YhbY family RNA-binding protein